MGRISEERLSVRVYKSELEGRADSSGRAESERRVSQCRWSPEMRCLCALIESSGGAL